MNRIAAYHAPQPDLIGFASLFAVLVVAVFAFVVRSAPERQQQGLTIALPYLLLLAPYALMYMGSYGDVQHTVAFAVFSVSAFGFALHNFQFSSRVHIINGVVSGLLAGFSTMFIGAPLAFESGYFGTFNHMMFWFVHLAFVFCWVIVCILVYCTRRSSHVSDAGKDPNAE